MLVRKTVTVLFCDVVTSSSYGERFDPEALRRLMSRYFDEMKAAIERHGGTVEKFIGDAVMAVFGVPVIHEDDALRAVRAAAEMRDRLAELNEEFDATWGVRLEMRIGVNTGEVVAGDPATGSTFVTGDAVNLAKRLEQAAGPGEILLGKATYPLVKDAISAGPLESFSVKGKSQSVAPFRLEHVEAGAAGLARRLDTPLVGRRSELTRLQDAFEAALRDRECRLFTVLGPAGIGKSRLTGELLASLGNRATALTGRCLPYGEGITFWPLTEIVHELDLETVLEGTDDAETVADRIRSATGASTAGVARAETPWAVRKLVEAIARRRPLVVCFEDIHWAEPTFLDLVEYLVGWTRDAPVLVLCLARPDLLDLRPSWASPRANADVITLEPLSAAEADGLVDTLRGDIGLSDDARARIGAAAEGNPLFVEQMVAMVAGDDGTADDFVVPPSIQALLAERLDRLDLDERAVIERAAVVGREFPRGAVVQLAPPELRDSVDRHLMVLVRKELIEPNVSRYVREDGFRFRHGLIRDAAYDGIPKQVRAELHAQFADWLERNAAERGSELDEIRGYHLEQAFANRAELGPIDEEAAALGAKAAELLGSAGRRAYARGDMPAAAGLLTRATLLLRDDDAKRLALAPEHGAARISNAELTQAEGVHQRAIETAARLDATLPRAYAILERAHLRLETTADGPRRAAEEAREAVEAFTALDDDLGLARALHLAAYVEGLGSHYAAAAELLERALEHAERAGARRERASILIGLAHAAYCGPDPVERAIERCRTILRLGDGDMTLEAGVRAVTAGLEAMRGGFDAARHDVERSKAVFADLGASVWLSYAQTYAALVEMLAGNPAQAEPELRRAVDALETAGARTELAVAAAELAEACLAVGQVADAERYARRSREAASAADTAAQWTWRRVLAAVLAQKGDVSAAEELAREAVDIAAEADSPDARAGTLKTLADVVAAAGDGRERSALLAEALALYEAKGNVVAAASVREQLAAVRAGGEVVRGGA